MCGQACGWVGAEQLRAAMVATLKDQVDDALRFLADLAQVGRGNTRKLGGCSMRMSV